MAGRYSTCRPAGSGSRARCPGSPAWTPSRPDGRTSLRPAPAGPTGPGPGPRSPAGLGAPFVHERFAEQASRRPDAAAVIAAGARLTYRELDQSANRLAHYLKDMGAGPETLIGVSAERGVEAVRGLLAIMKAGSGYLPLDPSLPPARLARICAEAGPAAILHGPFGQKFFLGRDQGARGRRPRRRRPWRAGPSPPPRSACTPTTCATPSTPRAPPAPPRRSRSATAAWPASLPNWPASTGSVPGTGWYSSLRSPSTPRSSR